MAKPSRPAASYRAARKAAARALAKINKVSGAPSRQVARDVERFEAMRRVSVATARGEASHG
ncbi:MULTISPECIES: hypothetical protein [Methylobacterium]|uniref:Uncharacterized protein n=2 Tax=Methylobacterium TaxID=407 RepID=A0ABQ4SYP6_9HYPH|nr:MULTISPECIES: hypothetical protein [Methylobacterium]PIU05512.1 MAG: hypothetical protein COT56_14045 [Methylobacterium sp. CG09_land_8_20_14_0_10_71_15]PIU13583.1 MAG: hypothetical protein COT28_10825 [Methylobacterium sp. CG08_land_8_20_14_0_20_71_15]GBU17016.1 hypothetical protein AwMethylo_12310 [Methylobacterium sp.]GJD91159.1 hypothetical protein BHAOGJBA_4707 [Methylobacterium hispanicum]GJE06894.1 hypothetical protein AOPFMNJM_2217 [Methylobacterium jeotgali]